VALDAADLVGGAVAATLTTSFQIGTVSLSLGQVASAAVALALTVFASRAVRFALDTDVYTRFPLRRGVPQAISTTVHYALVLLGVFLALGAAGFQFGQFSLLTGALGIGVGFGLQNVVNNFVSGLILLYERPVQVGDTVQLGELWGDVKRIGIRSSTVRTAEGADVIVPNGSLISDQVVNWTRSDRQRRIDLAIGVAYGSDPEKVRALLLDVAKSHSLVLQDPEPTALFQSFGESSLDFMLRCWTDRFESFLQTKSEIAIGVYEALRQAGIEIPFPQRDVRLRKD
jgi:small-conductance mechanosensitive channel